MKRLILLSTILGVAGSTVADYGQAVETPTPRVLRERIAAFHRTIVYTDEAMPNSGMLTYLDIPNAGKQSFLVKLVPGIERNGEIITSAAATDIVVEDFPGGVFGSFVIDGVKISTEIVPLCEGREAGVSREGAALYRIKTDPETPLVIGVGSGKMISFLMGSSPDSRNPNAVIHKLPPPFDEGGLLRFRGGNGNLPITIKTSGEVILDLAIQPGKPVKPQIRMDSGEGYILMAFGEDFSRTEKLVQLNVDDAREKVDEHYKKLAENRIETPEPLIDRAFESAIYTLEYSWLYPFGWIECPHHWLNMWHMQCVAGANWIGQADRSKTSTLHFGENLLPGGAVPHMYPNGKTHRTFGGSDQFYAWQARHLWKMTGDRDFAEQAAPMVDQVVRHAFEENDSDGNLLLEWGRQIGNQEDFIATPYDGTSPSIEGINILRTRAEFARATGDLKTAELYEGKVDAALSILREKLWLPDLGRFAYFIDPQGNKRLDGQYHTFLYPLLWNVVDGFDGYTSLRHMRDRLTGTNREVYCSNNFPKHVVGTHGYQAGAAQQPWAAWVLSAAGLNEETWRPLKAVSEWVDDPNHRGAWMEVSTEHAPGYFSPPAGLFIASVAEALFGLKPNLPEEYVEVSPSFPSNWPFAKLDLADYRVDYEKSGNRTTYVLETTKALSRRLRWKLPPSHVSSVLVNGEVASFSVKPGVGFVELSVDVPASQKTTFQIVSEPLDFEVDYPKSIAEGEKFTLKSSGVEIVAVDDRYNVFSDVEMEKPVASNLKARVQRNLLAPYLKYGRLGQLNFSRRTCFVKCRGKENNVEFWLPIDLTILPRFEVVCSPISSEGEGDLLLRNNTEQPIEGEVQLMETKSGFVFEASIPARSEKKIHLTIPSTLYDKLSAGDNFTKLILPQDQGSLDVVLTTGKKSEFMKIPIDADTVAEKHWGALRKNRVYHGPIPWGTHSPMSGLAGITNLTVEGIPGLEFTFQNRRFVPIGAKIGKPSVEINLGGKKIKKLYVLMFSIIDNNEMFSKTAKITVRGAEGVIYSRELHFPGDVDWWPRRVPGDLMSTAQDERETRFGLLGLLKAEDADFVEGKPPTFPQSKFWASSRTVKPKAGTFNVIEIDLGKDVSADSLTLETIGTDPGIGLLDIVAEK